MFKISFDAIKQYAKIILFSRLRFESRDVAQFSMEVRLWKKVTGQKRLVLTPLSPSLLVVISATQSFMTAKLTDWTYKPYPDPKFGFDTQQCNEIPETVGLGVSFDSLSPCIVPPPLTWNIMHYFCPSIWDIMDTFLPQKLIAVWVDITAFNASHKNWLCKLCRPYS